MAKIYPVSTVTAFHNGESDFSLQVVSNALALYGVEVRPLQLADDDVPGAALQHALRLRNPVIWHVGGRARARGRRGRARSAGEHGVGVDAGVKGLSSSAMSCQTCLVIADHGVDEDGPRVVSVKE